MSIMENCEIKRKPFAVGGKVVKNEENVKRREKKHKSTISHTHTMQQQTPFNFISHLQLLSRDAHRRHRPRCSTRSSGKSPQCSPTTGASALDSTPAGRPRQTRCPPSRCPQTANSRYCPHRRRHHCRPRCPGSSCCPARGCTIPGRQSTARSPGWPYATRCCRTGATFRRTPPAESPSRCTCAVSSGCGRAGVSTRKFEGFKNAIETNRLQAAQLTRRRILSFKKGFNTARMASK